MMKKILNHLFIWAFLNASFLPSPQAALRDNMKGEMPESFHDAYDYLRTPLPVGTDVHHLADCLPDGFGELAQSLQLPFDNDLSDIGTDPAYFAYHLPALEKKNAERLKELSCLTTCPEVLPVEFISAKNILAAYERSAHYRPLVLKHTKKVKAPDGQIFLSVVSVDEELAQKCIMVTPETLHNVKEALETLHQLGHDHNLEAFAYAEIAMSLKHASSCLETIACERAAQDLKARIVLLRANLSLKYAALVYGIKSGYFNKDNDPYALKSLYAGYYSSRCHLAAAMQADGKLTPTQTYWIHRSGADEFTFRGTCPEVAKKLDLVDRGLINFQKVLTKPMEGSLRATCERWLGRKKAARTDSLSIEYINNLDEEIEEINRILTSPERLAVNLPDDDATYRDFLYMMTPEGYAKWQEKQRTQKGKGDSGSSASRQAKGLAPIAEASEATEEDAAGPGSPLTKKGAKKPKKLTQPGKAPKGAAKQAGSALFQDPLAAAAALPVPRQLGTKNATPQPGQKGKPPAQTGPRRAVPSRSSPAKKASTQQKGRVSQVAAAEPKPARRSAQPSSAPTARDFPPLGSATCASSKGPTAAAAAKHTAGTTGYARAAASAAAATQGPTKQM